MTRVYTDFMHVMDTPEQFMQLQLGTRFRGRRTEKAPAVLIEIWSISRKPLYRGGKGKGTKLTLVADGQGAQFRTGYVQLQGAKKRGKDVFLDGSDALSDILNIDGIFSVESPLPGDAQINDGKGVKGLRLERMFVYMTAETFIRFAAAQKIELMLDKTAFGFTANHTNTVRDFAARIKPLTGTEAPAVKSPAP